MGERGAVMAAGTAPDRATSNQRPGARGGRGSEEQIKDGIVEHANDKEGTTRDQKGLQEKQKNSVHRLSSTNLQVIF